MGGGVVRQRGWIIGSVAVVVVAVVAVTTAVVFIVHGNPFARKHHDGGIVGGNPQYLLAPIPSSLPPSPRWKLRWADIVQAGNAGLRPASFGSIGDVAYFTSETTSSGLGPQWLFGVNVVSGKIAMQPLEIPASTCMVNRPRLLCIEKEWSTGKPVPRNIRIIEPSSGTVSFTGPTNLTDGPNDDWPGIELAQIGEYTVANANGEGSQQHGWYGVGQQGELTWFVPGKGDFLSITEPLDLPPRTLALGDQNDSYPTPRLIFSVTDGHIFRFDYAPGEFESQPRIFDWGWAFVIRRPNDTGKQTDTVRMFDTNGSQIGTYEGRPGRVISMLNNTELPTVLESDGLGKNGEWRVFGRDGRQLATLPETSGTPTLKVVGNKLFYTFENSREKTTPWLQYDLTTGKPGATCTNLDPTFPLGTDGRVLISQLSESVFDAKSGFDLLNQFYTAVDTDTCQTLWTERSSRGSNPDIFRAGNVLFRTTDEGIEPLY